MTKLQIKRIKTMAFLQIKNNEKSTVIGGVKVSSAPKELP
jgi:hypothetical protein